MRKAEILTNWYTKVWEQGDLDAIDAMFRPDTRAEGILPDMAFGPAEFKELVGMVQELIEEIKVTVIKTVEQGDWLSALVTVQALASADSRPIHVAGQVMVRYEGDIMVETYNAFDFITFFEQLGLLPEQAMPICLSGQRIG